MVFSEDINEIKSFINASKLDVVFADSDECIAYMTEEIDEDFLMNRAEEIKAAIRKDDGFVDAISKLAAFCDGHEKCNICPVNKYCNHYIKMMRAGVDEASLKMIDLFCGAGGLSLGFTQEGFVTSLANDIQECCVDTYAHNHPETPRDHIILGDIKMLIL